jgi:DNA replication protein DnaC
MLFTGTAGTGKTCAALCLLDHAAGVYYTMREILSHLVRIERGLEKSGDAIITDKSWWKQYTEKSFVVIDEIGLRGEPSPFQYDTMYDLADKRRYKPTIFISNLSISTLSKQYDERVVSRISCGTIVEFSGKDRRYA